MQAFFKKFFIEIAGQKQDLPLKNWEGVFIPWAEIGIAG